MYLVFLDIDGVFTSNRVHYSRKQHYNIWARFDPIAVDFMNKIYTKYPIKFVLMTSWKNFMPHDNGTLDSNIAHWVQSTFSNAGFVGEFASPMRTNPEDDTSLARLDRAHQVIHYLDNYGTGVKDYILFDDTEYAFNRFLGKNRFIKTDAENGLLFKHMKNAMSIIGEWDERS